MDIMLRFHSIPVIIMTVKISVEWSVEQVPTKRLRRLINSKKIACCLAIVKGSNGALQVRSKIKSQSYGEQPVFRL